MTTITEAFEAGVDAVIADNTLNKNGFRDAVKTVIVQRLSNAEATAWIDALIVEYERLGIINNPTYGNWRSELISEGAATAMALFDALAVSINSLPESAQPNIAVRVINLRAARDEINTSISTVQGFKAGETQQVKEALDQGVIHLQALREAVREELRGITGDPDTTT